MEREGVQCVNNTIAGEVEGASVDIYPTKKRGQEKCVWSLCARTSAPKTFVVHLR